jgi:hypothetical protein
MQDCFLKKFPFFLQAHIFAPVMFFPETKDFANFAVGKQALIGSDFTGERHIGEEPGSQLTAGRIGRDRIIGGVEHLKAQPVLVNGQMNDLGKITRVDIGPGYALADRRIGKEAREFGIFMRLDNIAYAQGVFSLSTFDKP